MAVEAVDMEVLKGPYFQVRLKLHAVYCKVIINRSFVLHLDNIIMTARTVCFMI